MSNNKKQMWVHLSFASVINHAKTIMERDIPEITNVDVTFVLAKNTIIDGRKILIVIPKKPGLEYTIRKKAATQNIYMV